MSASETASTPSKRYRTLVLFLLTLIYAFNFIDRQIIGILSPFIQADLELSNSQMGLLKGFLFALFYTVVGIPIAWLADRYNRVNIVSISLAVWSGFTALTGMANSFLSIGLARMGVGIGEAGGSPPSHSIISDMYSKDERSSALAIYALGIPLGLGFAYFVAGYALGNPNSNFDWRQLLIVWQIDYLLPFDTAQGEAAFGFQKMMYILALANVFFYGGGTFYGGALAQKLAGKSVSYYAIVPALSILVCIPLVIATFWVPSTALHLVFGSILLFFLGMYLGPSFAIAQTLAPINMRAMSTALFFLILNLIALGGGPTAVGFLADVFKETHGQVHAIRLAITICAAALVLSAISFMIASKTLPKDWADAEARNESK